MLPSLTFLQEGLAMTITERKAAGYFHKLAKAMLNAERYTGSTPNYQGVVDAVNAIGTEGFGLQVDTLTCSNRMLTTKPSGMPTPVLETVSGTDYTTTKTLR